MSAVLDRPLELLPPIPDTVEQLLEACGDELVTITLRGLRLDRRWPLRGRRVDLHTWVIPAVNPCRLDWVCDRECVIDGFRYRGEDHPFDDRRSEHLYEDDRLVLHIRFFDRP